MEGRQSSMAQLASWTDTMSQKKSASSGHGASAKGSAKPAAPPQEDDDGYGDDFEDYADDFDEEEASPPKPEVKKSTNVAPPKIVEPEPPRASAKEPSGAKKQPTTAVSQEIRINDVRKKPDADEVNQSRSKKFEKTSMFLAGTFTDRRAARVQKLLQSGVLEMQSERVSNQLQLAPMTSFELYSTKLRSADASIKQIAVPTENEKRDVEANTEEITTVDKSVQFTFTDDTAFHQAMERINLKKGGKKSISSTTTSSSSSGSGGGGDATSGSDTREEGVGLSVFLRRSSNVFEALFKQMGAKSLQDTNSGRSDIRLGDSRKASAAAAAGARTLLVRYSQLQPSLLLTVQPGSGDSAKAQQMGHYLIWDAAFSPGKPIHHLTGSGVPTCACFSNAQTSIVLAGTQEGSLHLWDLRDMKSNSSSSGDTDTVGKPCFSTGLLVRSTSDFAGDSEVQHMYPIVQVKSLDFVSNNSSTATATTAAATSGSQVSGGAVVAAAAPTISQFVSLDDSGLLIFWITSQDTDNSAFGATAAASAGNKGSRTVLVQTRSICFNASALSTGRMPGGSGSLLSTSGTAINTSSLTHKSTLFSGAAAAALGKHLQGNTLLTTVPGDSSTLLVTSTAGSLHKIARFGEPSAPYKLCRAQQDLLTVSSNSPTARGEVKEEASFLNKEINYFAAISCVAVTNYSAADAGSSSSTGSGSVAEELAEVSSGGFVLAGRMDGTMDLFRLNSEQPLNSWNLSNLSSNHNGVSKTLFVVSAKWCPFRKSLFTVVDSNGGVFVFDMAVDVIAPVHSEWLDVNGSIRREGADVSYQRNLGPQFSFKECRISVAVCGNDDTIRVRELSCVDIWRAISKNSGDRSESAVGGSTTTLGCWTSETYSSNLVSFASN